MSNQLRECINKLKREKDVKELLPDYLEQSMQLHDGYARIKMMMEYFLFYEVITEDINPYIASAQEIVEQLNDVVGEIYSGDIGQGRREQLAEEILAMRGEVMERMQVLTGYVDCFVVYEYILNRIQYRYEQRENVPEDAAFAQEVMNFIFGSKDTVTVNDNLRMVLGQLPMRMTRSHYFDLIKDCISVYKGSEIEALEGFLYMFRTSAMLYKHPAQGKFFTEFEQVLQELREADYENMDEKLYTVYAEKVRTSASKLNDLSDLYMQIGQIINEMYTLVVAMPYCRDVEQIASADEVVQGIHALFTESDCPIWDRESLATEEQKRDWLEEQLPTVEGVQEHLYDSVNIAEAALDELLGGRKEDIAEAGLTEAFERLRQISLLNSTSVFAELHSEASKGMVTAEIAAQETEKLVAELKNLFQGRSRMFRRAIMACTVEKLPTFFQSAQEVADYMMNALNSCDDEAEKYASKQLILEWIR
ncbi:MAG: hypothetical protein J1E62_09410 [Lachnospiraceae bacterium]|nr:hypothetical protein [Lachnospiraceae bacterium]